jgi:hypothetical protein
VNSKWPLPAARWQASRSGGETRLGGPQARIVEDGPSVVGPVPGSASGRKVALGHALHTAFVAEPGARPPNLARGQLWSRSPELPRQRSPQPGVRPFTDLFRGWDQWPRLEGSAELVARPFRLFAHNAAKWLTVQANARAANGSGQRQVAGVCPAAIIVSAQRQLG